MPAQSRKREFKVVPTADFASLPWSGQDAEIRRFGHGLVVKLPVTDRHEGDRTLYRLYEPTHERLPDISGEPELGSEKRLHHGLMLLEHIASKDGTLYAMSGKDHMWPKGVAQAPLNEGRHKFWKLAQLERVREITLVVFPESEAGYMSSEGQVCQFIGDRLTTFHLDDLEDAGQSLEPYVGWKVSHDMLGTGVLVRLTKPEVSPAKYAVRWRVKCGTDGCKRRITILTKSGCHKGAYCYVCDKDGKYLADLRNQYCLCATCAR